MAGTVTLTLTVLTKTLNFVTVTDSRGAFRMVTTYATDAGSLMELSGITAGTGDEVHAARYAGSIVSLNIERAYSVSVQADGQSFDVRMTQGTVQKALAAAGVTLGQYDYTEPALYQEMAAGDAVTVHRVVYQDSVAYQAIPFAVKYEYTSLFYKHRGLTVVRQEGADGQLAITSRERWVDGQEESSQVVGTQVTLAPVDRVILAYRAGAPVSSRKGPDGTTNPPSSYRAVYTGRATGYSSDGGRGASGLGLGYGTVAVNPAVIPYGSLLYICSLDGRFVYGYALATDTGGALQNGTALVDLYYETYSESVMNGVIAVNVYVVR